MADRDVLANVQVEIAATGREHEGAGDSGRPYDFIFDEPFDMLQHRISVVARASAV
jgi:hypothetical protein